MVNVVYEFPHEYKPYFFLFIASSCLSVSQVCDEQWVQTSASGSQPCETDSQPEPAGRETGRERAQRVGTRPREAGLDLQHRTGSI